MSLFDFFKNEEKSAVNKYSQLYHVLAKEHPTLSESDLVITSCVAGLLARVAYVDFKLEPGEELQIQKSLAQLKLNEQIHSKIVTQMAVKHIKEMAGLENHLYVLPLRELLTRDERYQILQSLFLVAASDGNVESLESEEIRTITKGLELSGQHFLAARAEVSKYLKALHL